MADEVWLPIDTPARKFYRIPVEPGPVLAVQLPDAIASCAPHPRDASALVSCWDGKLYRVAADGHAAPPLEIGSPARVTWSLDGSLAVAGTATGELIALNGDGAIAWKRAIPVGDPPAVATAPEPVVPGLPIYQGGRVPKGEHAYVGDIWVIKNGSDAVFVACGNEQMSSSPIVVNASRIAARAPSAA